VTGPARDTTFADVAAVDELAPGALLGVALPDGTPVCLVNKDGTIGALGGLCTHAEFSIAEGVLRDDGTIECVWHGARFDCRTGAARRLPAVDPLPVFPVRVEGGRVLVGTRALVGAAEEP
jgi:3-phenylpropionate/trans-cinnamate dioxygenase ferredoxin subunit